MTTPDGRNALGGLWNSIQTWLLPALEDEIGALDERHRQFVAVCEMCAPQNHMGAYRWIGNGCPPKDRLALCKAFIAKVVWDFATTRDLIDGLRHRPTLRRLCGWESLGDVPSEATFSRAFDAFSQDVLPQRISPSTHTPSTRTAAMAVQEESARNRGRFPRGGGGFGVAEDGRDLLGWNLVRDRLLNFRVQEHSPEVRQQTQMLSRAGTQQHEQRPHGFSIRRVEVDRLGQKGQRQNGVRELQRKRVLGVRDGNTLSGSCRCDALAPKDLLDDLITIYVVWKRHPLHGRRDGGHLVRPGDTIQNATPLKQRGHRTQIHWFHTQVVSTEFAGSSRREWLVPAIRIVEVERRVRRPRRNP